MLTLYDYLPSQNGYKVRLLLSQAQIPHRTRLVSIFEGAGRAPEYRAINPTGAVPAVRLDDGRVLSESNAILAYLAEGTAYLPEDRFLRAKVAQWMSFEIDYVQNTIGSLRYWALTGKLEQRPAELVAMKRAGARRALDVLDAHLAATPFLVDGAYSVADIAVFAYAHLADEAGIELSRYPALIAWVGRIRSQPRFLGQVFPYSIDPHASGELS
ncbi:glutathione S-transferase family protein [Luteimonas sp. RD2P54]|uniref:Glutathione S-transferase family protein n=1 Tax=Luteimonas endophytica TaxID=3042023 RepID=A0ABT6JCJ9_9GAMM|nr:glutathione S-transferase family protein [Luteimonas endophytica]MDH5824559.1 glutathione S-transferase family protein [Luteimonas endophytica]